jgi:SDR family mycofactocin-dependent oxidoreductase
VSGSALVTGAARGIGAATVRALAANGWAVLALDRCSNDPRIPYEDLTQVVSGATDLAGESDRVMACVADACDGTALADAVALVEESFGGLDAVVAAAGVIAGGVPLWDMPEQEEEAVTDVNLRAAIVAARTAIPALLRRPEPRQGRFIAVSSAAATRGMPRLAAYCAAKAGVNGLVRALAAELQGTGVTANSVSPGSTETPILDQSARLYGLEGREVFSEQQPLGRLIRPEEVAAFTAWLASPASAAVTGVAVPVDGGLSL